MIAATAATAATGVAESVSMQRSALVEIILSAIQPNKNIWERLIYSSGNDTKAGKGHTHLLMRTFLFARPHPNSYPTGHSNGY